MIITNSLGSNYSGEDIKLSLVLLFQPWSWKNGKETILLVQALTEKFRKLLTGSLRNSDISVQLFTKGRQAIGEGLRIFKVGAGDEVIVQAFTCVAVVGPILESGARPVYADVAPKSLNPTLSSIKQRATAQTKAVILQHTLGFVNPENEEIVSWCREKGITVIQDLAHALGAPGFKRPNLGASRPPAKQVRLSLNTLYILSFSQDKVVDGVAGGALVLPSGRPSLQLINKLINWSNFEIVKNLFYPLLTIMIRKTYQTGFGKLIHFFGKELGFMQSPIEAPYKPMAMPNALAAVALQQFKRLENISNHRRKIALSYNEALNSKLKIVSKGEILSGANLRYPIWVNNRDELEEKFKKYGYYLVDHWYDAPVSPEWINPKDVRYLPGSCPNAEKLAKHIFNLPTHVNISQQHAEILAGLVNRYAK